MIAKILSTVILCLMVIASSFFLFQMGQGIKAISQDSTGYRSGEIDFSKKDYICSDVAINSYLGGTIFGKTGCVSGDELQIKKTAIDTAIEQGLVFSIMPLLVGGFLLFGVNKFWVNAKKH